MATEFPELFASLAAEFEPDTQVKVMNWKGKPIHYITARTAMNRLDSVLGPENWWDDYVPGSRGVMGILTIRLPDGRTVTKQDAGGKAGMDDEGDDDKSGYSDAFKRACVKFGIGRYLYRDGVPTYDEVPPKATAAVVEPRPLPVRQQPGSGKALFAWAKESGPKLGMDLIAELNSWGKANGLDGRIVDWDIGTVSEAFAAMAKRLAAEGKLSGLPAEAVPPPQDPPFKPTGTAPGPMTIEFRDPLKPIKMIVREKVRGLYKLAFKRDPNEEQAQGYLDLRCMDHKLDPVRDLRNFSKAQHLRMVIGALEEDERDASRVASGDPAS